MWRFRWLRGKQRELQDKRIDHALQELRVRLERHLGAGLKSLVLFGAPAAGEFHGPSSDPYVLVVVDDTHWENLQRLEEPLRVWSARGYAAPWIVQGDELPLTARLLPLRLLEMKAHHRLIAGEDLLAKLTVDTRWLQAEVEQELLLRTLRLRSFLGRHGNDPRLLREELFASLPAVLTLLAAVLHIKTGSRSAHKLESADRLADLVPFDSAVLHRIRDQKIRRKEDELAHVASNFLDVLEKVLHWIGRVHVA